MVETKFEVANLENPTTTEEILLQNKNISLNAIHEALYEETFQEMKGIEMAHEAWKNHLRAPKKSRVQKHTFSKKSLLASRGRKMKVCQKCFIRWKGLSMISRD